MARVFIFAFCDKDMELIVVGAGPGDPELVTLKAIKALERADVILYDNLANKVLLDYRKESCELVYVGKTPYKKYNSQDEINALIKHYADRFEVLVRLKGGDPFVFGRGMEELAFAKSYGMKTSYIPGITSMLGIGLSGIPLTHRGISEGFWVITGTTKDGSLSKDIQLALQSKTTLVIYMGMKNLPFIVEEAVKFGKPNIPAAIIQNASLPNMKMAKGTVVQLPELVKTHGLTHPAIIVIGDVVELAEG